MSAEPVEVGPKMASDESQRLFADELKALIAGARDEASVTQDNDQDTIQVNGQPMSEDQPDSIIQPQIEQEPKKEPTYVTTKSNDQQQEAQAAEPTVNQEPASPSRKRPSPGDELESSPKPVKKEAKQCGVCQAQPGKYRCPRCPLMYSLQQVPQRKPPPSFRGTTQAIHQHPAAAAAAAAAATTTPTHRHRPPSLPPAPRSPHHPPAIQIPPP
ncbi:hypothetical protein B0T13DRAFT_107856 [Neurospora crassa]|nr:hypothetical protein B0T13DRAFT_107856 [Neurospora crassa]